MTDTHMTDTHITPPARPIPLDQIDSALVLRLRRLGDDYGPLGVALAAAALTDPDLVVARLIEGAHAPIERGGAYMPARVDDPDTCQRSARRIIRSEFTPRFSNRSAQARLLREFSQCAMTATEAALNVAGPGASLARIEGCRRRVSDLAAARYIIDSGARRCNPGSGDLSIVWRITTTGFSALTRLRDTGWS